MSRTHPPTLITSAKRTLLDVIGLERGARIVVATSGGPDSMALLHVLARLQETLGFTLVAHGVDHGLRAAAAAELDLAETLAAALGVPFSRTRVEVAPGANVQARARTARRAALEKIRQRAKADFIATAHHADDRAETVIMRLLRGSGASGLAVLPPRDGQLVRPFIHARRADIEAHNARHDVPFATDPSNVDPRFLRTRVRREVLPLLEALDPSVVPHLCALAEDLAPRREDGAGEYRIPRTARLALARLAQKKSGARIRLPGGIVASREHELTKKR